MSRRLFRDRFFTARVARAITSPAGLVFGSVAAGVMLATGAPVIGAVIIGAAGWALPVARAMRPGGSAPSSSTSVMDDLPYRWTEPVSDAKRALKRYRRALSQCDTGPLRDRLEDLESDFEESVQRCEHLARWGAEAEAAEKELDPTAVEKAARHVGESARHAAADQREVRSRLDSVQTEAIARLTLINGRLDEAVGRAVEMVGRARQASRDGGGGLDLGAGELAAELGALRAALDEVDHIELGRTSEA